MWHGSVVLVTGGTGTFGRMFVKWLSGQGCKKIIVLSRDEYKQSLMASEFPDVRYFLGDVRDLDRLRFAFKRVDYIVHAAALKRVDALEYNPTEAIRTNIDGSMNVIQAAIENGVKKVIALSTDKAVNPVNLYGSTKMVMEKLFMAANDYSGRKTAFSCVRYGNVIASRGSVIEVFQKLIEQGISEFPITDTRMTRFWIPPSAAIRLVVRAMDWMRGGEIFVPRIPSMKVVDVAKALCPTCTFREIGIRPGEKLHESLVGEDVEKVWHLDGEPVKAIVPYTSDRNDQWLTAYELRVELGLDDVYVSPNDTGHGQLCQEV